MHWKTLHQLPFWSRVIFFELSICICRPAKYPDLPPPSYDESMFGPTNVKEEVGDCHDSNFVPNIDAKLSLLLKLEYSVQDDGEHTRGDWNFLPKYPRYITKYWFENSKNAKVLFLLQFKELKTSLFATFIIPFKNSIQRMSLYATKYYFLFKKNSKFHFMLQNIITYKCKHFCDHCCSLW